MSVHTTNVEIIYLEDLQSMLHSPVTIAEQGIHLTLVKKFLDPASLVLRFKQGVNIVKCPTSGSGQKGHINKGCKYSVNFPILSNVDGGRVPTGSDLMCISTIA